MKKIEWRCNYNTQSVEAVILSGYPPPTLTPLQQFPTNTIMCLKGSVYYDQVQHQAPTVQIIPNWVLSSQMRSELFTLPFLQKWNVMTDIITFLHFPTSHNTHFPHLSLFCENVKTIIKIWIVFVPFIVPPRFMRQKKLLIKC